MWWIIISFVQPANNLEKWDLVAKITNNKWGHYHNRNLNNFFFDGKDCLEFSINFLSKTPRLPRYYFQAPKCWLYWNALEVKEQVLSSVTVVILASQLQTK
ncbi:hypothetical protein ACU8KH_01645 [Lachancea thermotolerans]